MLDDEVDLGSAAVAVERQAAAAALMGALFENLRDDPSLEYRAPQLSDGQIGVGGVWLQKGAATGGVHRMADGEVPANARDSSTGSDHSDESASENQVNGLIGTPAPI